MQEMTQYEVEENKTKVTNREREAGLNMNAIWIIGYGAESAQEYASCFESVLGATVRYYDSYDCLSEVFLAKETPILIVSNYKIGNTFLSQCLNNVPKRYSSCCVVVSDCIDPEELTKLLEHSVCDILWHDINRNYLRAKLNFYFRRSVNRTLQQKIYQLITQIGNKLTKKEIELLMFITSRNHTGASREEIMQVCWNNTAVHSKTLDVHLFNLRRKVKEYQLQILFKEGAWFMSEDVDNLEVTP